MDAAEVSVRDAASNLTRTRALYTQGYVSEQTMEQAENADQNARIAYETARNQYDLQMEYTTVTAPISGTVESRSVEPHDHVDTSARFASYRPVTSFRSNSGLRKRYTRPCPWMM